MRAMVDSGGGRRVLRCAVVGLLLVMGVLTQGADAAAIAPTVVPVASRSVRQASADDSHSPAQAPSEAQVREEVAQGEVVSVGVASVVAGAFTVTARQATGPQAVLDVVAAAASDPATVAVGLPQAVHVLGAAATPATTPATTRAATPATTPATTTPTTTPAATGDPMRPDSFTRPWPWNQYAMDLLCADPTADAQTRYRCDGYAWQHATGKGQVVAVVDQGVDTTHPDVAAAVLPGARCIRVLFAPCAPVAQTAAANRSDHGSHVAGIIAATPDNGIGIAGLARDATVLPIEVIDNTGDGTTTDVAAGVTWAVDNGATVINMSIGTAGANTNDPVLAAAVANALRLGIPVVAAAGNEGQTDNAISYPAAYPGVVGVASIDANRALTATSTRGSWVDVAAPGDLVVSTVARGYYGYLSGTSMATPHVSATTALLRQAHPELTPAQLATILTASAQDAGPPGRDDGYGSGVLRPLAALTTPAPPPPVRAGAEFHPIDPARVVDTRTTTAIPSRTARAFSVASDAAGRRVLPVGAVAVAYNLTVPTPAASGHLRVMPADVASSSSSAINFVAGQTIANGLVVKVDSAGCVRVFNAAPRPVNAVIDVVGYFLPVGVPAPDAGTRFTPVPPVRVYDAAAAAQGPLAAGQTRQVSVATGLEGQQNVVPVGAKAIAYNITVVRPTGAGHLKVMPGDVHSSSTSTINWAASGDTIANGLEVRIAADRSIAVANGASVPVRFLVDVVGYYRPGSGALFHPVRPTRLYDSRQPLPTKGTLLSAGQRSVFVGDGRDGVGSVTMASLVPVGATALAYNVTVAPPAGATGGHLRLWPADQSKPKASVINWPSAGSARANGLVVGIPSDRRVAVYNGSGDAVNVIVDALGYYQ